MRILPREESFFEYFEKHGQKTVEGCCALLAMVSAPRNVVSQAKAISDIEHDCDHITHTVVEQLHKTFITPLDRNEIYRLITKMDDVIDFVEAAADRISVYDIHDMPQDATALAKVLLSSAECVLDAVSGLRDLKGSNAILAKCVEINRLENEADVLLRGALARLFREEQNPITIMKRKEIYELLETATDRCEDVANTIEGVVLENS